MAVCGLGAYSSRMQYLKSYTQKLLTLTAVLAIAVAFVSAPRTHAATISRSQYPSVLFSYDGGSFVSKGITVKVSSSVTVNSDGSTTFKSAVLRHSSSMSIKYGGYVADGDTIIKTLPNMAVRGQVATIPLGNVTARNGLPTLAIYDDTVMTKIVLGPRVAE